LDFANLTALQNEQLRKYFPTAEVGDIQKFYELLQMDPNKMTNVDKKSYIDYRNKLSGLNLEHVSTLQNPLSVTPEELRQKDIENFTTKANDYINARIKQNQADHKQSVTLNTTNNGLPYSSADAYDTAREFMGLAGNHMQKNEELQANEAKRIAKPVGYQLHAQDMPNNRAIYDANTVASEMEQLTPTTSSLELNAALNNQNAHAAAMKRGEGASVFSNELDKFNEQLRNTENQQAQLDAAVTNEGNKIEADVEAGEHTIKANAIRRAFVNNILPRHAQKAQQVRDEENHLRGLAEDAQMYKQKAAAMSDITRAILGNQKRRAEWQLTDDYKNGMNTDADYQNWFRLTHPQDYTDTQDRIYAEYNIPDLEYTTAYNDRKYPSSGYATVYRRRR